MTLFTTAYAGSGKLDEKLVADHLNNLLPEELGFVFIPDGEIPPRKLVGLSRVVTWLESEVGKEGTIPVPDLISALIARRDGGVAFAGADEYEGGDDVALVMVYDPENAGDVLLAKAAHEQGIRVVDLLHAADDIVFEDEPPADEEVADDTEDRETPKLDETLATTPPWDTADERAAAAERSEALAAPSPAAAVANAAELGVAAALAARQTGGLHFNLTFPPEFVTELAKAVVREMGLVGAATIAAASEPVVAAPLGSVTAGEPATQPAGTKAYYYKELPDGGGSYRPARGIAKVDERKVYLTKEQEADARTSGMLK